MSVKLLTLSQSLSISPVSPTFANPFAAPPKTLFFTRNSLTPLTPTTPTFTSPGAHPTSPHILPPTTEKPGFNFHEIGERKERRKILLFQWWIFKDYARGV
jgi:hypothetical protein